MSAQRVIVSYAVNPSFQSSDAWNRLHAALVSQLPLRNIHWKSASRPSIRTIQELYVALSPWDDMRGGHSSQIPTTLLERPLLNVYIVNCESTDLEKYRTTIKKQIKEWHTTATSRKNQEWLIIQVVTPDIKTAGGNFFQLKGSVLDKIKADFNVDKRDRCVQLVWSTAYDKPAAWAEVTSKIKDGILSAFDTSVSLKEEEVKRSEGQRQMPGWNFCNFFILKESLASSFEGVNLFDDALLQFDELEASFYQVLKEKNLSWFGNLVSLTPKDDSVPLLDVDKKPYRDLIIANTISVFDFRIYLLSRQCALLGKLNQIDKVAGKVTSFLGAFGRRLRDVESALPQYFIESWTYSSTLSVVDQCEEWAGEHPSDTLNMKAIYAGNGELVELARHQLDIIGSKAGHLPVDATVPTTATTSTSKISQANLLSAISDKEQFYDLYINITNRAIDMYVRAGRKKFALKLHASLATLDIYRGRLDAGMTTYKSLPAHYAPHRWHSLEAFMLSRALDTHQTLKQPRDREWIHVLLSFLKAYIDCRGEEMLAHEDDKVEYVSHLVTSMHKASEELDSDLLHPDHPGFSVDAADFCRLAETQDGLYLDVVVHNHLPCPMPADQVDVIISGKDSERLTFSSPCDLIPSGKTSLSLFCPTSIPGTFILEASQLRMLKLIFQWSHKSSGTPLKISRNNSQKHALVRIPRDPRAFDIHLREPYTVELGKPIDLTLEMYSGRNDISQVIIRLSTTAGLAFQCSKAILHDGADSIEASDDAIIVFGIQAGHMASVVVPHSDASTYNTIKVDLDVEYITKAEPNLPRKIQLSRTVVTALPVSVNVEDFFRGTRLISKFTVISTTFQQVRIAEARLESAEDVPGLKIKSCSSKMRPILTVTSTNAASFLFSIESDGAVLQPLSLMIRYRTLREEVEALVRQAIEDILSETPSETSHREALNDCLLKALVSGSSWVERYIGTGELHVSDDAEKDKDLGEALSKAKSNLRRSKPPKPSEGTWKTIRIPVDVPRMNVVAAAQITILSAQETEQSSSRKPLYAGQPISAILSIETSLHWGDSDSKHHQYRMLYDIEELVRDWLVCGQKRGQFVAEDGKTHRIPITLIALHHGELVLPKVAVKSLPVGEITMGSMAIPSTETHQVHGAEKVLILPRGGRTTYIVNMGGG